MIFSFSENAQPRLVLNIGVSNVSSGNQLISPLVKNRPNVQSVKLLEDELPSVKQKKNDINTLGKLDGLLSLPNSKHNKVRVPDSKKIAAILLESNVMELQRHLLTITIQNQVSEADHCYPSVIAF